jgi:hypothetical protein
MLSVAVEPLPDGGGRHPQRRGKATDPQAVVHPQEVDHGMVHRTRRGGLTV